MRILPVQPFRIADGEILTPQWLNEVFGYARRAVYEVAEARHQIAAVPFQFAQTSDLAFRVTQASPVSARTFRIRPRVDLVVDRAFLVANLVSSAAVDVTISEVVGGYLPVGATTPWLSTGAASASSSTTIEEFAGVRFTLQANVEYDVVVSSTGTFTLDRFDVVMHVHAAYAAQAYTPKRYSEETSRNAFPIQQAITELDDLVSLLVIPGALVVPAVYSLSRLSSSTPTDARTFRVPRVNIADTQAATFGIDLYVAPQSVGTATTVTASLISDLGATTATATAGPFTSSTALQSATAISSVDLARTPRTVSTDSTKDYLLRLTSTNATPVHKAYAIVWFSRS